MENSTQTSPDNAPASAPTYDPAKTYDVQLKRSIEWPVGSGFYFLPRDHQLMNGALCQEIADGIAAAQPV